MPHHVSDGRFITHADMLSDLRASYTTHTTPEVIDAWRETPMLVVDEFGLCAGGKDEGPMLHQVFASRYDRRRPTIFTSNLELPGVREIVGRRLLDRVTEDYEVVVCRWESHRTGRAA